MTSGAATLTASAPLGHAVAVALVCVATLVVGALGLRLSRTTSDFFVASRMVTPRWNASAIGGEYLSGASFLGVAGLIFAAGVDMLWYSVGYTAGYLVLLVLVAAPLRRSGAYTLPDFAEIRLRSGLVRRTASVLVVGIGWLYLLPQFLGAGVALQTATGAPRWLGTVLVVVVVAASVSAGGMRSVTIAQAFQYWLKLTAIALPVFLLLAVWHADGSPSPADVSPASWSTPLSGPDHPVYRTYSLLLALLFGTMGLPHVLVRLYTNPDGRAARRTVVAVIGLLGAFYLFPPVYGALGRIYAADLLTVPGRSSSTDAMLMLLLPERMLAEPWGGLVSALLTAGAFAAFLSTSSGLTISVAGVLSQDLLRGRFRASVRGFRVGTGLAVAVPAALSLAGVRTGLADTVGLAFALAASTFCPLLVLGIWWRGLTRMGALAGLWVGGLLASTAVLLTVSGTVRQGGWPATLLAQPAAWSVPLAFAVMVLVSRASPGSRPAGVGPIMVRLHAPESLELDRGDTHPRGPS